MSKFRNRVAKLSGLAVLVLFGMGSPEAGALLIWDGITPVPNDSTSWAGLGADATTIPKTFSATSTLGLTVSGSFAGNQGLTAVECPAVPSCSWTGGFTPGDHLIATFDNTVTAGSGPLTLGLGTAVFAGGLEIQAADPGAFTAQVQAFNGAISLGTESLASDAAGDPIFIGARDTAADITRLVFSLTSCTAQCDANSFAVDSLKTIDQVAAVPAPLIGHGLTVLLAVGGVLFGGKLLERRSKSALAEAA
jgi:hypothetical protein